MERKQKICHISSLFAVVLLLLSFHLLGGGSAVCAGDAANAGEINTSVPSARKRELSSNKLNALALQQREESARQRREQLQSSSFDFLGVESSSEKRPDTSRIAAMTGKTAAQNTVVTPKVTKPAQSATASSSRSVSREVMREKRRRLQEMYGIELPEEQPVTVQQEESAATIGRQEYDVEETKPQAFHGISEGYAIGTSDVRAVVHGDQRNLGHGSTLKLRLLDPVSTIYGTVPANTLVYGRLFFSSNRAMVQLESITYRNRVIPFRASVYDMDGFEGISVPENMVHNAGQQASQNVISSTPVHISTGIGMVTSAANAVGTAVKAAVQGSVREQKISISSNYSVILKSEL